MPVFGRKSKSVIATLDIRLQLILKKAIKYIDFSADSGHRDQEEQRLLVKDDKSKTMNSKHLTNPSLAVDISPYPIDWGNITKDDLERFCFLIGVIMMIARNFGIELRWGRDWDQDFDLSDQTFNDYGHLEIVE